MPLQQELADHYHILGVSKGIRGFISLGQAKTGYLSVGELTNEALKVNANLLAHDGKRYLFLRYTGQDEIVLKNLIAPSPEKNKE